jgi:small subunit ribosomal protein S19
MSRSLKKGPYVDQRLLAKVERQQERGHKEPIKTWARDCTIVPDFIGQTFLVHNGRVFMKLFVTEDMVGHKLGEFAPTRIFKGHSGGKRTAAAAAAAATGGGGGAKS